MKIRYGIVLDMLFPSHSSLWHSTLLSHGEKTSLFHVWLVESSRLWSHVDDGGQLTARLLFHPSATPDAAAVAAETAGEQHDNDKEGSH